MLDEQQIAVGRMSGCKQRTIAERGIVQSELSCRGCWLSFGVCNQTSISKYNEITDKMIKYQETT